ncbi:TetR-like C-terminal domain-containing protein [Streptomyces sp. 8K308]|uniref:TetR-like C-terminal domain-containing protein n=1 Tax=Streptomyces sp. 8K308 TaxID=2530388 RepID=UPI001FB7F7E4|nr:TetR-like C-terminal domain-containing protein [Streptomyces sp. 8K308]
MEAADEDVQARQDGGDAGGIEDVDARPGQGRRLPRLGPGQPRGLPPRLRRPVPGYQPPEGGPAPDAARRVCLVLTAVAAAAWPHAQRLHADSEFQWSDFDPGLLARVRPAFPDLPPAAVALALHIWGRLHGLVSLEIYGHLRGQTASPEKLFQEELTHLVRALGIPPAA